MGLRESYLYKKYDDQAVQCRLCNRLCRIAPGEEGFCKVRRNDGGKLMVVNYGLSTYMVRDVIETEGIYHFWPGTESLSVGTFGCNLHCGFCQNWRFSRAEHLDRTSIVKYTPEQLVEKAKSDGIDLLCWTFNDPIIWYEFILDTAGMAREQGITSVFKSSHFITIEALEQVARVVDIFSLSLKSINDSFYRTHSQGWLEPVLDSMRFLYQAGKHIEITNLLIPTVNDSEEEIRRMASFILDELDADVPLHFARYHPDYKFTIPRTSVEEVLRARGFAKEEGLRYVYTGNLFSGEGMNTYCPSCGELLIKRMGNTVEFPGLSEDARCSSCGSRQPVVLKG